jgi:DNA uptake protein ComE-like DNA-binding protein
MKKYLVLMLFFLCLQVEIEAQSDTLDRYLERLIENYAENNSEEGFEFANSFELLETIRQNPYNINLVTEEELNNLFFLNPIERNAIISHRKKYGNFLEN